MKEVQDELPLGIDTPRGPRAVATKRPPPKLAPPAPPLDLPREPAAFTEKLVDEIIAAKSSERSCRCQAKKLLAEAGMALMFDRADEVQQLTKEAEILLQRAAYHLARVVSLKQANTQRIVFGESWRREA